MKSTRKFIKEYCAKNDMAISALENKAKLSRDSIHSFLVGKVSDLKLSNAVKIADTIGCSIDELAGRKSRIDLYSTTKPLNTTLLKASQDFVLSYLEERNLVDIELKTVFSVIDIVYDYSFKNHQELVDIAFSNWFCNNFFSKLRE